MNCGLDFSLNFGQFRLLCNTLMDTNYALFLALWSLTGHWPNQGPNQMNVKKQCLYIIAVARADSGIKTLS
jgi:hypothetical protein